MSPKTFPRWPWEYDEAEVNRLVGPAILKKKIVEAI